MGFKLKEVRGCREAVPGEGFGSDLVQQLTNKALWCRSMGWLLPPPGFHPGLCFGGRSGASLTSSEGQS